MCGISQPRHSSSRIRVSGEGAFVVHRDRLKSTEVHGRECGWVKCELETAGRTERTLEWTSILLLAPGAAVSRNRTVRSTRAGPYGWLRPRARRTG